jgi:hypothetical protein
MSQTKRKQYKIKNSIILCHRCSPRRIILIITIARMMILEALPEIQLVLLHPLVDGLHLLLHRGDGLLRGAHASIIYEKLISGSKGGTI